MKKVIVTAAVLLFTASLTLNAQDDKKVKKENKEQKVGDKKENKEASRKISKEAEKKELKDGDYKPEKKADKPK